jgi:phosphoribosylformylglycinamidine cyclo-ligase
MRYQDTGVSLERADQTVARLRKYVEATFDDSVVSGFGHFAGVISLGRRDSSTPHLVASMDGVGTKVLLAAAAGAYATAAGDVVRHGANDCLAVGARPLFFLDYVAWGKVDVEAMEEVARGLSEACREVGCVLLGGETAEMPDLYRPGDFDLAGCMIGTVMPGQLVDGSSIRPGDRILALPSTGLHTNGYTLARNVMERAKLSLADPLPGTGLSVGDALLAPHRAYTDAVLPLVERGSVSGLAHVTGGGIAGNLVRVLPENCVARLLPDSWSVPPVFGALQDLGGIPDADMQATFNLGVGYLLVTPAEKSPGVMAELSGAGEAVWQIGEIVDGQRAVSWDV